MEESSKAMMTEKEVRCDLRSGDSNSELDAGCFRSASNDQEDPGNTVGRTKRRKRCASNDQVDPGNRVGRPREPINVTCPENAREYYMNHKNRGICLIFNHEIFDDKESKPRKGTDNDVYKIWNTFKNLSFNVRVFNDATRSQIFRELQRVKEIDHTDNDCLCIFVLTHGAWCGNLHYLWAKDDWYPSKKIWEPFTGDNCPTLAGKPKLFFYVACRGGMTDPGISLRTLYTESQIDALSKTWEIPIRSDMLLAYSTVDEYVSWREELSGSPYVQNLCPVIDFCAIAADRKYDLLEILTITARQLAITYESYTSEAEYNEKKQISSFTSMLIRKLYLVPK